MKIEPGFKQFIIRAVVFLLLLLLVFPFIRGYFTVTEADDPRGIVFFTERIALIFGIALIIVFLMLKEKLFSLKEYPKEKKKYLQILLIILALALFFFTFLIEADLNIYLQTNSIHIRGNHADLGYGFIFGESISIDQDIVLNNNPAKTLLYIDDPESSIRWHGSRKATEFNVTMSVNGKDYDISEQYAKLKPEKPGWMEISPDNLVKGENEIGISTKANDKVGLTSTFAYSDNFTEPKWNRKLFLYATENPYTGLFGFLLNFEFLIKLAAIVSLFFGIFGLGAGKFLINRKEALISLIFAYIAYFFTFYFHADWRFFSNAAAYISYPILKLFSPDAYLNIAEYINLGIGPFITQIAEPCSGIEGLSFFTIMSILIIAIDWKKVNKNKILILFPLGLIGMFLTNVLRITSIILVGKYIDADFAVNTFHSNIGWVLFILYFLVFWYFAYGWMTKKTRGF